MMERGAFERLIEKGRRRGGLSTEDLRAALPIDRMQPDEIAMVVLQIEEEGVLVDLDEELLARSGAPARTAPPAVPVINLPGVTEPRREGTDAGDPALAPALASAALTPTEPVDDVAPSARSSWVFIVIAAGLVLLLALVAIVLVR